MKDYEGGKRCLSPSIFRKSKGPIVLTASAAAITSTNTFDTTIRGLQTQGTFKKPDGSTISKDISIQEYDINQCLDLKDVYCK